VDSFDRWTLYSVDAVAKSDAITVFTHSLPEWTDFVRSNNDVYLDDASLTAVGAPQPVVQPASSAPIQPAATPTLPPPSFAVKPQQGHRSDGAMLHVVQPNDTLFGIALAYGVTVDDIVQLNSIKPGDFLQIGQELVVKGSVNSLVATLPAALKPTSVPTVSQSAQTAALPQPAGMAGALAPGGLCVQAFSDHNGNGVYDQSEELVAGVRFSVLAVTDQVISYTTTGLEEPHCFAGLAPRAYTLRAETPQGYVATTDAQIGVALASGQTVNYSFGILPPGSKGKSASSGSGESGGWLGRDGGTFFGAGVGVLIAVGVITFLLVSRRK
jgi:LysM repeat protein